MVVRQISATCVVPFSAFNVQTRHLRVYDDRSLSLSLQIIFESFSLCFEGSLVAGWLCYHPFTNMQELLLPFFCMGVRFIKIHIYTLSLYNFFNFSHLFSFEYIHFFPTIHKFSHLPPSTTNQPSLSLNFTWCQNKQLWI